MAVLKQTGGIGRDRDIPLTGERMVLGRSPHCEIVLDKNSVSRQHVQIVREGEQYFLEDLNSHNATYLNGRQIQRRERLHDRDTFTFCGYSFTFQSNSSSTFAGEQLEKVLRLTAEAHSLDDTTDQIDSSVSLSAGSLSESLLKRVQGFDDDAWDQLDERYRPVVIEWAHRAGLQPSDAADVAQEVFRIVTRRVADFRREQPGDTFRGWLWIITQNKIRECRHARARQPLGVGGDESRFDIDQIPAEDLDNSLQAPASNEHHGLVHRAIDRARADFEERTWQAFWLSAVEDKPAADVAAQLGMSVGAVYTAKSRVVTRLRETVGEMVESSTWKASRRPR